MDYRKYKPFKRWCLNKGYCTQEMYDSVNRNCIGDSKKYTENKRVFFKAMLEPSKIYLKNMIKDIEDEMLEYPKDSLVYSALEDMLEDFSPTSKH